MWRRRWRRLIAGRRLADSRFRVGEAAQHEPLVSRPKEPSRKVDDSKAQTNDSHGDDAGVDGVAKLLNIQNSLAIILKATFRMSGRFAIDRYRVEALNCDTERCKIGTFACRCCRRLAQTVADVVEDRVEADWPRRMEKAAIDGSRPSVAHEKDLQIGASEKSANTRALRPRAPRRADARQRAARSGRRWRSLILMARRWRRRQRRANVKSSAATFARPRHRPPPSLLATHMLLFCPTAARRLATSRDGCRRARRGEARPDEARRGQARRGQARVAAACVTVN